MAQRKTIKFVKAGPSGLGARLSRALDRTDKSFWDAVGEIGKDLERGQRNKFEDEADRILNDAIKAIVKSHGKLSKG